jgi:hypothetical protein
VLFAGRNRREDNGLVSGHLPQERPGHVLKSHDSPDKDV